MSRHSGRQMPGRRNATRRFGAWVVAVSLVAAACDDGGDSSSSSSGGRAQAGAARLFDLRLSEGSAARAAAEPLSVVGGDPLDSARVTEILDRLPDWITGTADPDAFNWPVQSPPPPRPGTVVQTVFPPDEQLPPPVVPTGSVKVLRRQPEGDVAVAPYIAITFDRPMVPITTVSQLDEIDVPVTISPAIDGRWQWIGTRTLRFDHTGVVDRLPMATTYNVTVPKGMRAADGSTIDSDVTFGFRTPAPSVVTFAPEGEGLDTEQVFVAVFDQLVDPAAVLAAVTLVAGSDRIDIRQATSDEIGAADAVRWYTEQAREGTWVAFVPQRSMPTDTAVTVTVGPGVPSAEGSDTDAVESVFRGRTYAPLRIVRASCSWGEGPCPPGSSLYVEFNNALDLEASDVGLVSVSPALQLMRTSIQYSNLVIDGVTLPRTSYRITVPGSFTDVHGQTLGDDQRVTVAIGDAPPTIAQFDEITTLDPFSDTPILSLTTVGHPKVRVRAFEADPDDYATYRRYQYDRDTSGSLLPDWTVLADRTISIEGDASDVVVTDIDLTDVFGDEYGSAIVLVESVPPVPPTSNDYWSNRPALTWAQRTDLGLDAYVDSSDLYAWVTDLRTGAPRSGVTVELRGIATTVDTTATDGVATLGLPVTSSDYGDVLVATDGDDTAIMLAGAVRQPTGDSLRWYVFDDRGVYQPGETLRLKGWVRRVEYGAASPLMAVAEAATVEWRLYDAYGVELGTGVVDVSALGGFDLETEVPANANLGNATVQLTMRGERGVTAVEHSHTVQVQQYRRPEFEVAARVESDEPHLSTAPATLAAAAEYYAGGPLVQAPVTWSVSTRETTYSPPGWSDFTFGVWTPWWGEASVRDGNYYADSYMPIDGDAEPCCYPGDSVETATYSGTTDGTGTHYLQLDFEAQAGGLPDLPVAVNAEATVADVNRQAWSGDTSLLVHASDRYVGLRSDRSFVRQGDPLAVQVIVTDIDGAVVPGVELEIVAGRVVWEWQQGEYVEQVTDTQTCTITSAADAVACEFDTPVGGEYRTTAVVQGSDGGRNRTELTTWVSGASSEQVRNVEQQSLTLVPDGESYQPGDTAEVLVQAPFENGHGLVVLAREGVRDLVEFDVVDGSAVVQVPITERDVPALAAMFEVVGTAPRLGADGEPVDGAPARPAYAVGSLSLSVPPLSRTLTVDAAPRESEVLPGATTTLDVRVTDADGNAVAGAEFAVVVVDEAVLALSGYTLADPLSVFYAAGWEYLTAMYGRSQVQLVDPLLLAGGGGERDESSGGSDGDMSSTVPDSEAPSPSVPAQDGGSGEENGYAPSPIDVRTNFDALALFAPSVTTGADGSAAVEVDLPDTLTRYRVMVVAVSGTDRFGSDESTITARLPLSVRPSAPRFANYGDSFELPVVVQNRTDAPMDVEVVLQVDNLTPADPTGVRVSVPANDRVEVRFPVSTQYVGTARFRVAAVGGDHADAAQGELPVYTPVTTEAFATYGSLTAGSVGQPLDTPVGVVPGFGGLEISTSSTSLQALTDAVLYLVDYEYDSSDALASRILAIAALRDVLDAFDAEGLPSAAEIESAVRDDIDELVRMQHPDGGWNWWNWRSDTSSDPWVSVVVTHALVAAIAEGYDVPSATLEMAMQHIADIEAHIPAEYGEEQRNQVRAYALWVQQLAGRGNAGKASAMFREVQATAGIDVLAWLWSAVDDAAIEGEIARVVNNRAVETGSSANFTVDYDDGSYMVMQSDRRVDAIVLDALLTNDTDNDLVPKVVEGLLGHRVKGAWDSVQENAFVLLALRHYFDEYEAATPDLVARVWLGDRFAGEQVFVGRTTATARLSIPMLDVLAAGDTRLVVSSSGSGRLYYRIALRYAPDDLALDPLDRGFVVQRTYEAVDDPTDVRRNADGSWTVEAGARVRVTVTMVAESQRTHVALVDPLPAGFEAINPEFAVSQSAPVVDPMPGVVDEGGYGGGVAFDRWWGTWYEHQQLRTDRVEAFTTWLSAGTYTYSYLARATTPGEFVIPPARAEMLYAPDTFGRTATDHVRIG